MSELSQLRTENNELEKKLTKENSDLITRMYFYLLSSNLKELEVETIRKDLTGMALEAQQREERFSDAVGEDYKQFCDELIANGRTKSIPAKILEVIELCLYAGIVLLIVEMITAGSLDLTSTLTLTPAFFALILFAVICGTIVLWILSRAVWGLPEKDRWKNRCIAGTAAGIILIGIPLFTVILPKTELITIHPWPVLAAAVILLAAVTLIRKRVE